MLVELEYVVEQTQMWKSNVETFVLPIPTVSTCFFDIFCLTAILRVESAPVFNLFSKRSKHFFPDYRCVYFSCIVLFDCQMASADNLNGVSLKQAVDELLYGCQMSSAENLNGVSLKQAVAAAHAILQYKPAGADTRNFVAQAAKKVSFANLKRSERSRSCFHRLLQDPLRITAFSHAEHYRRTRRIY